MVASLLRRISLRIAPWTALLLALAAQLVISPARADDYPSRAIHIIVPYSAGGSSDAPMRVIAQQMAQQMGQAIVIENKPGQGAMIGAEYVARSAPDGYTLLLASNPQAISATLYSRLTFDPVGDFAAISLFGREPGVLVVNPKLPVRSVQQFIDYVKARPGKIDYASSGNGSAQHLFTAMFLSAAGLQMMHIPYRGSAQAVTDVVAGQVMVAMPGLAAMMPHIREKRLVPLAVTSDKRSPLLPDVPTLAESGFPGFSAYVWSGLVAPKGTPPAIIDRLNRELKKAMESDTVKAYMNNASVEIITNTPAEFQAFFLQEKERDAKVIKEADLKID